VWAIPLAVDFFLVPHHVDVGFVGSGSAIGAVLGGLFAFFLGYPLEQIVAQGALIAIGFGALAAIVWLIGCGVEFVT
jgi:hypothetical protein